MKHGSDLDDLLGYQLQMTNLIAMADARETLAPFGISPAKLTALLLIRANPGCDQTALGRALTINRSSAMKIVNFLVEKGFIERRPGRNLRTNALHMLPEGERRLAEMLERLRDADTRLGERLAPAERKTLLKLLRKVGPGRARKTPAAS
jgi:DNA-binding MarR family transcriptional regulator